MSHIKRITRIKAAPISWKERDLLTAAERYMNGVINFSLINFVAACFPKIDKENTNKIEQIWACATAAYHLQQSVNPNERKVEMDNAISLQLKAARIYEQEAQRILGSIFPMEHNFWSAFYIRQEEELTKPMVAIDALHFLTQRKEQIAQQLLIQSLKLIMEGHYTDFPQKKNHFENAKRLLVDLPLAPLQDWLNQQLTY